MTTLRDYNNYQITSPSKYFFDNEDTLMKAFLKTDPLLFLETKDLSIYHYESKGEKFSFVDSINSEKKNSTKYIIKGFIEKIEDVNKNNIVFTTTSNVLLNILKMKNDGQEVPDKLINYLAVEKSSIFKNIYSLGEYEFYPYATLDQVLFEKAIAPFNDLSLMVLYRKERTFLLKNITIEIKTFFNNFVGLNESELTDDEHFSFINENAIMYSHDDYFYLISKEETNLYIFDFDMNKYEDKDLYDENDDFIFSVSNFQDHYVETCKKMIKLNVPNFNIDVGILTNFNNHSFKMGNDIDLFSLMSKISAFNHYLMDKYKTFLSGWELSFELFKQFENGNNILKEFLSSGVFTWNDGNLYTPALIKPNFYNIKTFSKFEFNSLDDNDNTLFSLLEDKTDKSFFVMLFSSNFCDLLLTYTQKEYDEFKEIIDQSVSIINKYESICLSDPFFSKSPTFAENAKKRILEINNHYSLFNK